MNIAAPARCDAATRELARRNPLLAGWKVFGEPYRWDRLFRWDDERSAADIMMATREAMAIQAGSLTHSFLMREKLIRRYACAVPDDEALAVLARHAPLVQIGAGTGYWAYLLRRFHGVDILPFDCDPPRLGKNTWKIRREFVPVCEGDERDAARYPDRALFLCWPPMTDMAAKCLKHYRGRTVIYIGEGHGGCTADDEFFAGLEDGWTEVESVRIPQWHGIHDSLSVWARTDGDRQ